MGFKEEVAEIVRLAPKKRQTMLFSATFSEQVRDLMALSLKQPVRLAADAAAAAPKSLVQEVVRLKGSQVSQKEAVLLALCARSFSQGRTIVFTATKQKAHRLKILFGLCKLPPAGVG
ncbi:ATP-dependent RNA helicase DDX27 [Monoraphidium neglectum]|uniref:ATP-dependent RNA helicase DDX27 n=1 Tax=Monoraphidium neglectum TaxID=145388 RepID=A0A0D2LN54_9CHLO|nr:ATP-dependent RNA helicase DDX27 [Monoraphidium neglectum]KIY91471.1 ATP-dependent RNA helicase DDX27 [Monoraphidium neglectum]|eukprot:XP_013890491.1 ATP-dependent RNA helicase DDX27 [Monoraphidium neglectum]